MTGFSIHPAIFVALACLASYVLCGIPFGKIFAKTFAGVDLQKVGSGNIGTTNALRAAGKRIAILTLLCDVFKGIISVNLAIVFFSAVPGVLACNASELYPGGSLDYVTAFVGLFCVVGHMFSPYLNFKGGKSIAVGVGVLFAIWTPWALLHLAIFAVLVALTRYVSVGSIATAGLVGITASILFPTSSLAFKLVMGFIGLLIVWAHRSNIRKLLNGTESTLSFSKRVQKMDE